MANESQPCAECGTKAGAPALDVGEAWLCATCAEGYPELRMMGWEPA